MNFCLVEGKEAEASLLAVPALPDAMCPGVPDWVVSLTD